MTIKKLDNMKKLNYLFLLALSLFTSLTASAQIDALRDPEVSRLFAKNVIQLGHMLDCDPWDDSKACTDIVDPWENDKPKPKDPKTPTDPKEPTPTPKDPKKPAEPKKPSGQATRQQQAAMKHLEYYIAKGKAGKYLSAKTVQSARKRYAGNNIKSLRARFNIYAKLMFECWPCK